MSSGIVRAAGGVLVRTGADRRDEVLLVHRPRYDDWTLPKGKAEPGENDEACALREAEEETGLVCDLGQEVAAVEYEDGNGRRKRVRYFAMHAAGEAVARDEVDEVRWLRPTEARRLLTYERDRAVVRGYFACGSSL